MAIDSKEPVLTLNGPPPTAENVGRAVLDLPPGEYRLSRQAEGLAIFPEPRPSAAEALAVLREVEWSGMLDGMRVCPACGGVHPKDWDRCVGGAPSYRGRGRGHSPDCRLGARLKP